MKKALFYIACLFFSLPGIAQVNIYIDTAGSDLGDGSVGSPFATFQAAIDVVTPGDTINFNGGVYYSLVPSSIDSFATGKQDSIVTIRSTPGQWAIIDGSLHCEQASPPAYNSWVGMEYVEWLTFKNIELRNFFQCAPNNSAVIGFTYSRNLTFENVIIHDISTPRGYALNGGAYNTWTEANPQLGTAYWPTSIDTTRWINCDVYNTCDTLGGGNAGDGWKITYYGNNYVEWDGCRAWNFSDDGLDPNSIDGAEFVVKNSWFMSTQKYERYDIEGNGVKFTAMYDNNSWHSDSYRFLKLFDNIFADNNYFGTYDNLYVGGYQHLNTYQFGNVTHKNNYGIRATDNPDIAGSQSTSFYRNNIAFQNTATTTSGANPASGYTNTFSVSNYSNVITLSEWYFLSVDLGELIKPRQADGSLPYVNTFRPRTGSPLINAGTPVALSDSASYSRDSLGFAALAPDIGPFEYVPTSEDENEDILSFTFPQQSGYSTYDTVNNIVHASIFYEYRHLMDSLIPIVLPTDRDTISPGFKTMVDFSTQPVQFTVSNIADPGKYELWNIYIDTAVASTYADVRTFYAANMISSISNTDTTIGIFFETGTDTASINPTITIDRGATITPASGAEMFWGPGYVDYTVTAEDEATQKVYRATINELKVTDENWILGYNMTFPESYTTSRVFYSMYVAGQSGDIESLSIYHEGGTGNMRMALYDNTGVGIPKHPDSKLSESAATTVNAGRGWQNVQLASPVTVTSGDTLWIGCVFQNSVAFRVITNMVNYPTQCYMDYYGWGYNHGFIDPAEEAMGWSFIASTRAIYADGGESAPNDITDWSFPEMVGSPVIDTVNHTVTVTVQRYCDQSKLTPTITLSSGATVNPNSQVQHSFSSPAVYAVTSSGGYPTQNWTVTVQKAAAPVRVTKADRTAGKVELNNGRLIKYK